MNLYADLGVSPGASQADIARAYRNAAKKVHPDNGGEPEAFRRLVRAKLVLSDPERRAKYDQTGEVDEEADHLAQDVLGAIAQALEAALSSVGQSPDNVWEVNVLELMRAFIESNLTQGKQQRNAGAATIGRLEQARGRFSVAPGKPNQIDAILAGRLADLRRQLAKADANIVMLQAALDALKAYSYRVDRQTAGMGFYPLGLGMFTQSNRSAG